MKTQYYAIINKRGNLAVLNKQLSIYWNKEVAEEVCKNHPLPKHIVIPIKINAVKRLLTNQQ